MSEEVLRAIVYIDAMNLYYRVLQKSKYNWLDVKELCEQTIAQQCNYKLDIITIKYFTAQFEGGPQNKKARAQATYLKALKLHISPSIFELHKGRFKKKTLEIRLGDEFKEKYDISEDSILHQTWEEKKTDVNIATQFLHDAHLDRYDCGILISHDVDLEEPLRLVRNHFSDKKIGIISPTIIDSTKKQKLSLASLARHTHFICGIDEENLKASQLPDCISGTNIRKPDIWR